MTTTVGHIDLSDDHNYTAGFPQDFFTWLRANDPVFWHEPTDRTPDGEGFWVVSRYADVRAIQLDAARFSSAGGGVRDKGGTSLKDERIIGTMLNHTDDPLHLRLRALVNRGFTPRTLGALEHDLATRAHRLLDEVDASGGEPVDFVRAFARELPAQAICIVLGIPEADRLELLDWLDEGIETESGSVFSRDSMRRIRIYGEGLIADKRTNPDGGIMSTIIQARLDDGSQLDGRELLDFFGLLFPAGAETTRNAISTGIMTMARQPDEWTRLRADLGLIPTAIEELLRWATPSVYKRRTVSETVELHGKTLRAGDKLTFWEMSANRDESVFEDPFRFDIGRTPNPHLSFGWGVHFCLGANLARLELAVALRVLVERYRRFELATDPERLTWMPNARLSGLKALPLRLITDR